MEKDCLICQKCKDILEKKYKQISQKEHQDLFKKFKIAYNKKDADEIYRAFHQITMFLINNVHSKLDNKETLKECEDCKKCLNHQKVKYLRSINVCKIFDFLIEYDTFKIMKNHKINKCFRWANVVRKKLLEFRGDDAPIIDDWKGFDYYYLKLFNYSYILKDHIPDKLNYLRNQLKEEIFVHPLASHGFRYNQYLELQELLNSF